MKQIIAACLLLMFLLCQGTPAALATQTIVSESDETAAGTEETTGEVMVQESPRTTDSCGEAAHWSFSGGTLTISGTGATDDFSTGTPWAELGSSIASVVITDGITYLGAYAFENCDSLTSVSFGTTLRELGTAAFRSCDGLTELSLPASLRVLGEDCLRSCAMLKTIRFDGGMPSFRLNCLWDTYAQLIFPAKNPWPLEHIAQLEESFQGRIAFLASDGTDPYGNEDEQTTEATTEATTVATEAETTAPTTAPTEPSEAPTAAPEPETAQAQTEPQTTLAAITETQPEKPERRSGGGVALAAGLCALSAGMLLILIRGRLRSGGKYSR